MDSVRPAVVASVIIPALNAERILPRQLSALARQTFTEAWEVIVAENGSTDATAHVAMTTGERPTALRVVDASERRGISHARNVGAAHAAGRFLLFCDADDVVSKTWVVEMVAGLQRFDLVGGRLEYSTLNEASTRSWRSPVAETDLPWALGFLPFAVGANFGIRKEVYFSIGGCDEGFSICCDDVDLSWRVQLASHAIGFAPSAIVHYQLRTTFRDLARQQFAYGRNEARLYKKFKACGVRRPSLLSTLSVWLFLVTRWFHLLRSPTLKGNWIREASYRAGRLVGGLRFRTAFW